jgi:HSP20 family molecular chaperone IbpA
MTQHSVSEIGSETEAEHTRSGSFYRPLVDIIERPKELVVVADMPGVKSGEIDIQFEDGSLTIRGPVVERRPEHGSSLLEEYGVGEFQRTFRVGESIDASRIAAEYSNGVLRLTLPKADAVLPRKIKVDSK